MTEAQINAKTVREVATITEGLPQRATIALRAAAKARQADDVRTEIAETARAVALTEVHDDLMSILR